MSLRETLNQNRWLSGAVAGLAIVAAASVLWWQFGGDRVDPSQPQEVWFYDLEANRLIEGMSDQVPPITTNDGHVAVVAHVYTCGQCNEEERFIAWLERYSEEAKAKLEEFHIKGGAESDDPAVHNLWDEAQEGLEIRALESDKWLAANSPQARDIKQVVATRCPDSKPAQPCTP